MRLSIIREGDGFEGAVLGERGEVIGDVRRSASPVEIGEWAVEQGVPADTLPFFCQEIRVTFREEQHAIVRQ